MEAGSKRRERREELRRHLAEDADWPRADGRSLHDCRPAFFYFNINLEDAEEEQSEGEGGGDSEAEYSEDLKVFVGNLPFTVDSAQLAGLFEQAGSVEMVETFQGRPLRVNSGPPPPRDEFAPRTPRTMGGGGGGGGSFDSANKLYVGNLSWGVDNSTLENLFSEQGKVLDAKVIYDRDSGRSRGFGFVTYGSADEVNNAISNLDGVDLDGRQIRVTVAESKPREQRRF
ncbi:31 kDa ribonucleoprotein, chloroplastic [Triticum urartu]|uniref:31 kDa ribonucleoprotein, chloroplastic n=1 Tax=Triticum urartu TaxID=4572 RepID=M7ZAW1_TRIUA|nr:31 kDa ribonucleoprotein, chloroplastic [Triticum urartu]